MEKQGVAGHSGQDSSVDTWDKWTVSTGTSLSIVAAGCMAPNRNSSVQGALPSPAWASSEMVAGGEGFGRDTDRQPQAFPVPGRSSVGKLLLSEGEAS